MKGPFIRKVRTKGPFIPTPADRKPSITTGDTESGRHAGVITSLRTDKGGCWVGYPEVGMHLDLTEQEAEVLRDFLERWLGDLSMEISHTDNPIYRRAVRVQRDALRRVYDEVMTQFAARPPTGTAD